MQHHDEYVCLLNFELAPLSKYKLVRVNLHLASSTLDA